MRLKICSPIRIQSWVRSDFQAAHRVNKGHGRIEERTLTTSNLLNSYLDWPGIGQVFRLERRFTFLRKGQTVRFEQMVHYGMTSLSRQRGDADHLLSMKRSYWLIETGLHLSPGCHLSRGLHQDVPTTCHAQPGHYPQYDPGSVCPTWFAKCCPGTPFL